MFNYRMNELDKSNQNAYLQQLEGARKQFLDDSDANPIDRNILHQTDLEDDYRDGEDWDQDEDDWDEDYYPDEDDFDEDDFDDEDY